MIAFGPIPSRRLGQSLGINNIPPKHCSYDCVYCQVGPTPHKEIDRRVFYPPEEVFAAVQKRVNETRTAGARIDYLTFVPDGEPTLDINLGKAIALLRPLGLKIAVISNSSFLWQEDVRKELKQADLVSIKIDATDEETWRKINRPSAHLFLSAILEGALAFANTFAGELITETMLVRGLNDRAKCLAATAEYLEKLNPAVAYLAVATRPPSESWVQTPGEEVLTMAYQIFAARLRKVELLAGFSSDPFASTGDVVQNLLAITAVHPMREREAVDLFERAGVDRSRLAELVEQKQLVRVLHAGQPFYVRKIKLNTNEHNT